MFLQMFSIRKPNARENRSRQDVMTDLDDLNFMLVIFRRNRYEKIIPQRHGGGPSVPRLQGNANTNKKTFTSILLNTNSKQ